MDVVTGDAGRSHDDRRDQPDMVAEQRVRRLDELLVGIATQALQGSLLEIVELVRRAILERKVRNETIADVVLLLADYPAELQR